MNIDKLLSQYGSNHLITSTELGQILRRTSDYIRVARHRGDLDIPYIKSGRKVLYQLSDVIEYINSNRVESSQDEAR